MAMKPNNTISIVQQNPETQSTNTDLTAQEQLYSDDHTSLEEQWANLTKNNNNKMKPTTKPLLKKKSSGQVLLEGYVDDEAAMVPRTKSLTDEDLDELKGCVDLGFGFSYDEIPELCNTLPALELCYSMSQKFLDDHHQKSCSEDGSTSESSENENPSLASSPIANWKISSPGDHPEDVKARLKYWAQAVACTVKLCSY